MLYRYREKALMAINSAFDEAKGCDTIQITTEQKIAQTIVVLRVVCHASIRNIQDFLHLIDGKKYSYGKIQGILSQIGELSKKKLQTLSLQTTKAIAVDEVFQNGRPIFTGVDIETGYLFLMEERPSRDAENWCQVFTSLRDVQGVQPKVIVKDGALGISCGARQAWPTITEQDDLFHVAKELLTMSRKLERKAYRSIEKDVEYTLQIKKMRRRMKKTNQKQNANVQKLYRLRAKYREKMHREIDAYDRFEQAGKEISRFMELTPRGCGILRSNKEVSSGLQKIAQELQKDSVSSLVKMGRYLEQRAKNLGHYLDALHSQLEVVVQDIKNPSIVEAAVRAYQASLLVSQGGPVLEKKSVKKNFKPLFSNF